MMAWDVYQWGKKLDDKTNFFAMFWTTEKSEKQKKNRKYEFENPKVCGTAFSTQI